MAETGSKVVAKVAPFRCACESFDGSNFSIFYFSLKPFHSTMHPRCSSSLSHIHLIFSVFANTSKEWVSLFQSMIPASDRAKREI